MKSVRVTGYVVFRCGWVDRLSWVAESSNRLDALSALNLSWRTQEATPVGFRVRAGDQGAIVGRKEKEE